MNLPVPGKTSGTDKALRFHLARQYEEVSRLKGPPMRHARRLASAERHSGLGSRLLVYVIVPESVGKWVLLWQLDSLGSLGWEDIISRSRSQSQR